MSAQPIDGIDRFIDAVSDFADGDLSVEAVRTAKVDRMMGAFGEEMTTELVTAAMIAPVAILVGMLFRRVKAVEAELDTLKQNGLLEYTGAHDATKAYRRGMVCTRRGSLFVALQDSCGVEPGAGSPESIRAWQCAVSRGKDGRDAR